MNKKIAKKADNNPKTEAENGHASEIRYRRISSRKLFIGTLLLLAICGITFLIIYNNQETADEKYATEQKDQLNMLLENVGSDDETAATFEQVADVYVNLYDLENAIAFYDKAIVSAESEGVLGEEYIIYIQNKKRLAEVKLGDVGIEYPDYADIENQDTYEEFETSDGQKVWIQ